jgi:hypothetical protein
VGTGAGGASDATGFQSRQPRGSVYTAFGIGLAKEGTFEVKLVKDAGTGGGLRSDEPAPQAGGFSPALVLSVALLFTAATSSVAWRIAKDAR